jgi:hypothetical protein
MLARFFGVLTLTLTAAASQAQTPPDVARYLGGQGCAVGPESRAQALRDGIDGAAFDAFVAADAGAVRGARWTLLSEDACTITLPPVKSALSLQDADVAAHITAPDAYPEDPGCYFEGVQMMEAVARQRGWDADRANAEYIKLLAQSLIEGSLRFYSTDILRTPPSFLVTIGEACAAAPVVAEAQATHALMRAEFGPFMRAMSTASTCDDPGHSLALQTPQARDALAEKGNTNAWLFFELELIAYGAGWLEGMRADARGTPRPPLCAPIK